MAKPIMPTMLQPRAVSNDSVCSLTQTHRVLAMMYGLNLTLKNEIVKIAPKGRVNCIAPGWVKTPMAEEALKDPQTVYRVLATSVIPS
jgi:NAD(P)-dependent dehydrogenase (short-subunit alcohol dehydrogenase family)